MLKRCVWQGQGLQLPARVAEGCFPRAAVALAAAGAAPAVPGARGARPAVAMEPFVPAERLPRPARAAPGPAAAAAVHGPAAPPAPARLSARRRGLGWAGLSRLLLSAPRSARRWERPLLSPSFLL